MRKAAVVCARIALIGILGLAYLAAGGTFDPGGDSADLQVRILQTKEDADCIILSQDKNAVMIDTGEAQDIEHVMRELNEAGIEELDALILTHPDKDHIGGALPVLREFPVKKVIYSCYAGENEEWKAVETCCRDKKIQIYYPNHVWKIHTGYVNLLVYPPQEKHYKEGNNYSLAVLAEHGKVKMFFGADAMRKRSEELLTMNLPEVALYKVAHHGRANKASDELFETLRPAYAVVTSDSADEEIVESSARCGSRLLFSCEGDVVFESDGKRLNLLKGHEDGVSKRQGRPEILAGRGDGGLL